MRQTRLIPICFALACVGGSKNEWMPQIVPTPVRGVTDPREKHFASLTQYTFEGENAEAYWSFDGTKLSMQRRAPGEACDKIYTLPAGDIPDTPPLRLLSNGQGATTCAHYLPDNATVIYASTHLAGPACPPKPDMSLGYVWALYDSYDIFKSSEDGKTVTRLTDTKGYDAEATVCGVDGSIVFTSTRDGDIELYRMDKDGGNVKRLTFTPGYDGGAFFNKDCSKLTWRASRPAPGKALDDYQSLLAKGLVRPSKLEIFVGNADGSDATQITSLNAASFAPFFFPDGKRILFSSNVADPKGREFDIWAVNIDGTDLEQITFTKGFDGFPMFSPDGKYLAFSSNRATAEGKTDTNLFVARWQDLPRKASSGPAERIRDDVSWLADAARGGRGIGSDGLRASTEYIEKRFAELQLTPSGTERFRHAFEVTVAVNATENNRLSVGKKALSPSDMQPLSFSANGTVKAPLVFANYGIESDALNIHDFRTVNAKGKIVLLRRYAPPHEKLSTPDAQRAAGDLRKKAFYAKAAGAVGVLIVDVPQPQPNESMPAETPFPELKPDQGGDVGIPAVMLKRALGLELMKQIEAKRAPLVTLQVELEKQRSQAFNLVGTINAQTPSQGVLVLGAHYDHLGFGGAGSLAPGSTAVHGGADDNASGTAVLLEVARQLVAQRQTLSHDVVMAAFSGEEEGLLGSAALVASKPAWLGQVKAMVNLDMVGRLRDNTVSVLGTNSAPQWNETVSKACLSAKSRCTMGGDGYGPSDHMSFYTASIPVLHFFTGAHSDYHKPTDTADKLNAHGAAQVAATVVQVLLAAQQTPLTFAKSSAPAPMTGGDMRTFGASLGTVPDYAASQNSTGVVLADVRPQGAADKAGLKKGDVIKKIGRFDIRSVEDLMIVLQQSKPGETVRVAAQRAATVIEVDATFQEGRRR
jgi:Peptidase family M28/PA domain/WD40-like Beta Propeller Repeat/PDZ domain